MQTRWRPGKADMPGALLCLFAAVALCYAVITAARMGKDILSYRTIASSWASGTYLPDTGMFYGPPPWTAVALYPLSVLSPSQTVILMLAVNLAATGLILWMAVGLWGRQWTTREKLFLCSLFLVWASFRITVRNGQLSLLITTLILGFIWMRRQERASAAGILLGLSLIKYPVSFLFLVYTLWKREWRTAGIALGIPIALTLVYAARLDLSPVRIIQDYANDITGNLSIKDTAFTGSTEIKPMIDHFLGGHPRLAIAAALLLWTAALLALGIAFSRARNWEDGHLAALSLL